MEVVILMGIQASGKSTFFGRRLRDTHVRVNLDMLRTRHRERRLVETCIEIGQSFVVDNTNPTREDRARYVVPAKEAGARVVGYYFRSSVFESLERNAERAPAARVCDAAVRGASSRMELPSREEGFDELYHVAIVDDDFVVSEWTDEV